MWECVVVNDCILLVVVYASFDLNIELQLFIIMLVMKCFEWNIRLLLLWFHKINNLVIAFIAEIFCLLHFYYIT